MKDAVTINDRISVPLAEIEFKAVRSQGPGGQNVNKVATAIQLRFDAAASPSLPEDVRQRLLQTPDSRITPDGTVVIKAQRARTQERNREDALKRLVALIAQAAVAPTKRRATRPKPSAIRERLADKRRRSEKKSSRRKPTLD